jgi:hypothetical protein
MKVLASSVIRSTFRGDAHGGLYIVDTDKGTSEQVVNWDYEDIRWDLSLGGDRGLRGLIFHNDKLFAAGARNLFVFNKDFKLIETITHPQLDGTHELAIEDYRIYNIANCYDAILVYDLITKQWIKGFQHIKGRWPERFDPNTEEIPRADTMHLDTVVVRNGWVWYAGSTTDYLYGYHLWSGVDTDPIKLYHKNTHNARFWKDGIVFNRSLESDTTFQTMDGELVQRWPTPRLPKDEMTNVGIPHDHARSEYTRGIVLGEDSVCVGSSPACVHEFVLGKDEPVSTVRISHDIRNSICGMTKYEW